jgi:hypothetical protein
MAVSIDALAGIARNQASQQGRDDVQSQVDSFSEFNPRQDIDDSAMRSRIARQDQMRFRTYSAPLPTPKTPAQKAYTEIRTKTPDMTSFKKSVDITPKDVPKKTASQKIYESVVGSPAKPANLYGPTGHFANQQIIEDQAKLGTISHKLADQLKGKDIAQQGLNPMLGMLMGGPYQMITNAIDQGDIWGGITSGANQALSNIQGILSAYGMWNIDRPPPQSDSNSAWINLLQQITQGGSN